MRMLACTSICFYTHFTHCTGARQVFGTVVEEKFCIDIDNNALRHYFGSFLVYFVLFTSACDLVSSFCL